VRREGGPRRRPRFLRRARRRPGSVPRDEPRRRAVRHLAPRVGGRGHGVFLRESPRLGRVRRRGGPRRPRRRRRVRSEGRRRRAPRRGRRRVGDRRRRERGRGHALARGHGRRRGRRRRRHVRSRGSRLVRGGDRRGLELRGRRRRGEWAPGAARTAAAAAARPAGCALGGGGRIWRCGGASGAAAAAVAAGFRGTTSLMSSGCFLATASRSSIWSSLRVASFSISACCFCLSRARISATSRPSSTPESWAGGVCTLTRTSRGVGARVTTRRADRDRPPQGTLERLLSPSGARRAASPSAAARGQTAACEEAIAIDRTRRRARRERPRARAEAPRPRSTRRRRFRNPPSLPQRKRVADVPSDARPRASPRASPSDSARETTRRPERVSRSSGVREPCASRPRRPVRRGVVGCASAPRDGRYGKADTIRRPSHSPPLDAATIRNLLDGDS
jgi:hypothetical protein